MDNGHVISRTTLLEVKLRCDLQHPHMTREGVTSRRGDLPSPYQLGNPFSDIPPRFASIRPRMKLQRHSASATVSNTSNTNSLSAA